MINSWKTVTSGVGGLALPWRQLIGNDEFVAEAAVEAEDAGDVDVVLRAPRET